MFFWYRHYINILHNFSSCREKIFVKLVWQSNYNYVAKISNMHKFCPQICNFFVTNKTSRKGLLFSSVSLLTFILFISEWPAPISAFLHLRPSGCFQCECCTGWTVSLHPPINTKYKAGQVTSTIFQIFGMTHSKPPNHAFTVVVPKSNGAWIMYIPVPNFFAHWTLANDAKCCLWVELDVHTNSTILILLSRIPYLWHDVN